MNDFIQLKKDNVLRIGIKDDTGKETGEHLEFDLEDIELLFRLDECEFQHRKNIQSMRMQLQAIKKKKDFKNGRLMSSNQKEEIKLINDFFQKEMKALDLFLGKDGCKKLLNGRNPYIEMFDDFVGENGVLKSIIPLLNKNMTSIEEKIKKKYSSTTESNVLR